MRTLKFRIWNPSGQNMLYDIDNVFECLKQQIKFDGTMPDRGFIPAYNHKGEGMVWMQFTGLLDKNEKEIYEGDIILFQTFSNWDDDSMRRHIATVIFKEGCFMWKILEYGKKSNFYRANETEPLRNTNCTWGLEIIGNVHENPELL